MIPVLQPQHHWVCPKCTTETVTHEAQPHSQLHRCKGMHGIITPMVPKGIKAGFVVREREDYIGTDTVRLQNDRPVMSVTVDRDDGQDSVVFAPAATGGAA